MTELLTQEQVELQMYHGGIKRAEGMFAKAEEKGRAVTNPYAKEILREYVLPLAAVIDAEVNTGKAGRRMAHAQLLFGLDPEAVALLAVRSVINGILMTGEAQHRGLAYAIGRTIQSELVLQQIEDHNPELYHTLVNDFARRLSKDERHRMTVFKMQAAKAGLLIVEWPKGARDQVGMFLLGLLEQAGLVVIDDPMVKHGKPQPMNVSLAPEILERIDQVKAYMSITMPVYGPCVEPPKDWVNPCDGGFHTRELRRTHPTLVRHRLARTPLYREAVMPVVLTAVNTLQRTAWRVNERMLDIIREVAKHFNAGEIVSLNSLPKPDAPVWLAEVDPKADKDSWPDDRKAEFKTWKRAMANWYTERKLLATRYGRLYSATRGAEMFRGYPRIYFTYFADSRGRLYPMTYGLNPQGSDLQRSLITFAEGMPVDTPDAIKWFHVQGANKYGFDKATLEERQQWVVDRQDLILTFAEDPISNTGWKDADKPLQFLAWCLEYREWVNDSTGQFLSRLPISMDGSCNGLQNLSALFRDEVGGEATNLTANTVQQDIYKRVAHAASLRLQSTSALPPETESLRQKWLTHGINRSVVKRSVMTTPYGVTKRSATDYVIEDYLKAGKAPCFAKEEHMKAASLLMSVAWPAIGDVVVKGRLAMDWLRKSARVIVKGFKKDEEPVIWWITPSGFPASQAYYEIEQHRVVTRLHGTSSISVVSEIDEPDSDRHASGLAPNFVHSMDASHLHLTTTACARRGIDAVAMIHDDYGTHAANAQALYEIIRDEFVKMYEDNDPIADFEKRYPGIPPAPAKGSLDIQEVRRSPYFFS